MFTGNKKTVLSFPADHGSLSSSVIVRKMASELNESVRSQIVILSKEQLSQLHFTVTLTAVHGTLLCCFWHKLDQLHPKHNRAEQKVTIPAKDQYIKHGRETTSSLIQNQTKTSRLRSAKAEFLFCLFRTETQDDKI